MVWQKSWLPKLHVSMIIYCPYSNGAKKLENANPSKQTTGIIQPVITRQQISQNVLTNLIHILIYRSSLLQRSSSLNSFAHCFIKLTTFPSRPPLGKFCSVQWINLHNKFTIITRIQSQKTTFLIIQYNITIIKQS